MRIFSAIALMAPPSTNSPCAACKFLRRKCTQECVFAPYFPPDQPQKFASVHKVFGASNVGKLLSELHPSQREEAGDSLAYEAQERIRDPIYGCVGKVSMLQQHLKHSLHQLECAKRELACYVGPTALLPITHPQNFLQQMHASASSIGQPFGMPTVGPSIPTPAGPSSQGGILLDEQQQQQILETQQIASAIAAREQEMALLRNYEHQQQQQQELARFNSGVEGIGGGQIAQGFNQMNPASPSTLVFGPFGPYDNSFLAHQQQQQVERLNPHHEHMRQQRPYVHQQDSQHQQRHEHQFLQQQHQQRVEHPFLQQQNPQHQQMEEHQFVQQRQNPQHQQREEHQFLQQQNPQHQHREEHQFLQQQNPQSQRDGSEDGMSLGPTP